jgi:hypothetical protein
MFCDACGAQLTADQSFCSRCGKPVRPGVAPYATAVPVMAQSRVVRHSKILGILWLVFSVFHLLPGLFLIGFSHSMRGFLPSDVPIFVPGLLHFIGMALSLSSVAGLVAGWGLLNWRPWARMLAIVMGVLQLLNFPFGTALGIYTLWVLLPTDSEQHYRQQSTVAAM